MEIVKNVIMNLWKLIRRSYKKHRLIYIGVGVALVLLLGCLVSCHRHTPGAEATCTEPQVCTKCGEILVEALGHTPGEAATCISPQVCTVCGEVLTPATSHNLTVATCTEGSYCTVCGYVASTATGHEVGEDGVCTVCGEQVCAAGTNYIKPGANGAESDDTSGLLAETSTGHYNNNTSAYYASYTLVCGDYALEYSAPSAEGSETTAEILSAFAEKYPNQTVSCMLIPKLGAFHSPEGYDDLYEPIKGYINNTYAKMSSAVHTIDIFSVLESHKDEYIFYRTDMTWTSLGAYYGAEAYIDTVGGSLPALDSYETVTQTDYLGMLYYSANEDSALKANLDYTVLRFPQTGYTLQYTWDLESWINGMAINPEKYGYSYTFMEGDQPCEVIRTDNHNGKTLMLIKDSSGNVFAPYMIDCYETIVVLDFRDTPAAVEELVNRYSPNEILVLCDYQSTQSYQTTLKEYLMS